MNKVLDFPKRDLGDSHSTHNTRAHLRPGNPSLNGMRDHTAPMEIAHD